MFCTELRLYRLRMGLKQAELGRLVGVSGSAVGMYEQGRRLPGPRVYSRLKLLFARQGFRLSALPDAPEPDPCDLRRALSRLR